MGEPSADTPRDIKKLRNAREVSLVGDFLSVAPDSESGQLFVGNNAGKVYQIDLAACDNSLPAVIEAHISFVSSLTIAGDYLISAGSDHRLVWWERRTREKVREFEGHPQWIRQIALSPDGAILASVCDDMVGRLFDSQTGELVRELRGEHELLNPYHLRSKLYSCVFSPDGCHIATADQAGRMVVWEVSTGKKVSRVESPLFCTWDTNGHTYGGIRSIDFSPDGRLLAAGGNLAGDTSNVSGSKALIQIYNWKSGEQTHDFRDGNFFFERIKFHHRNEWLLGAAGAGSEQKLVFFDLDKKVIAHQMDSGMLTFDLVLGNASTTLFTVGRRGTSTVDTKGTLVEWSMA